VQNVGFRAFVAQSAQIIGVSGWVRNVGLDTVEAVAEGSPQQIEQFIQMMKAGPRVSRVDEARLEEEAPTGEFPDFDIRYSR
jgi:acylphosphatase